MNSYTPNMNMPSIPSYTPPPPPPITAPSLCLGTNVQGVVAPFFSRPLGYEPSPLRLYPLTSSPLSSRQVISYQSDIRGGAFPIISRPAEDFITQRAPAKCDPAFKLMIMSRLEQDDPLPTPRQPIYTDMDRFQFIRTIQLTQLQSMDLLLSRYIPQQWHSKFSAIQALTRYQPPKLHLINLSVPPPKSSVKITVIGEEEPSSAVISRASKIVSSTWVDIKVALAYIGLENLDLPVNQRSQILSTYSQSVRNQTLQKITASLNSGNNTAIGPLRSLTSNHIDFVQSYDWIRFDPTHLTSATSIPDLFTKMAVFTPNMSIHGTKVHPLCAHTTQSFEAKSAELNSLFQKFASEGKPGIIGTYLVNGINVRAKEFEQYVELRSRSFNDQVLTIGSYNKSFGFFWDFMSRIPDESLGMENFSTEQLRNQLAFAAKTCDLMGKDYYFTFELHSEATLQYYNAFQKLSQPQKELVQKHILVLTLGGICPVPDSFGKDVLNIYSRDDIAYKSYGKAFLNNPDYTVEVVNSLVPKKEQSSLSGDHGYIDKTYRFHSMQAQDTLDDNYHYLRIRG